MKDNLRTVFALDQRYLFYQCFLTFRLCHFYLLMTFTISLRLNQFIPSLGGISKTLKQRICISLKYDGIKHLCPIFWWASYTFKDFGKNSSFGTQNIPHAVQIESAGPRLRVDYSKGIVKNRLNKFFNENGIKRMLEVSDYDQLDKVSSFPDAIDDHLGGNSDTEMTTFVFTSHTYLVNCLNKRWDTLLSSERELIETGKIKYTTLWTLLW